MFFQGIPEELSVPLLVGLTLFLLVGKFTFLSHLSWALVFLPIWLPLLVCSLALIGLLVIFVIRSLLETWL